MAEVENEYSGEDNVKAIITEDDRGEINSGYPEVVNPAEDESQIKREIVEQLSSGVLEKVLPDFERAKTLLTELNENQRILIETIMNENKKFNDSDALVELTDTMNTAKDYHAKLLQVRKKMVLLHEKSAKLKKRALKLQQQKQREALVKEQNRERQMEKERLLIAQPARQNDTS